MSLRKQKHRRSHCVYESAQKMDIGVLTRRLDESLVRLEKILDEFIEKNNDRRL